MKIKDIKVLPKPGESIHFRGNRVTKRFDDEQIIRDRVERAKILKGLVPEIISVTKNSYTYAFVTGDLLSEITDVESFRQFLVFCQKHLWNKRPKLTPVENKEFLEKTKKFYFDKTLKRVEKFYKDTGIKDAPVTVNGKKLPTLKSLLRKIDWQELSLGVPGLFHGDLQPENILVTKKGFKLLDWRHDFEGLKHYADIYYDFAKLHHALIVSNEVIRNEQYRIAVHGNKIEFEFLMKSNLLEFKEVFEDFLKKKGYNVEKVRVLSALIYLNIAPLHHDPYNKLLYYVGLDHLSHALKQAHIS